MTIAVIGSGYVGLVTGACLAELGHHVTCIDRDLYRVQELRAGGCPLYEPGLPELIARMRRAGRLSFTGDMAEAMAEAQIAFIAVGTPAGVDGSADLSAVHAAAAEVARHARDFTVIVTKSTVPAGTGDALERVVRDAAPDAAVAIASNPEFLREGCAIDDFMRPDRIVVGTEDARAERLMTAIYAPLTERGFRLMTTDRRTAELIKYAANAFLAVKICFINEISDLCERIDADALRVAEGMGLDTRIGPRFLAPGPGYGGSCFPKDTLALLSTAESAGVALPIVRSTTASNARRKRRLARRVEAAVGDLRGATVAILGLTFKADTDDIREAAALDLIPDLLARGAIVRAFDPQGMPAAARLMPDVDYCDSATEAARDADAVVVLTEWRAFRDLDLSELRDRVARPILIDFRNLYRPADLAALGWTYVAVGRHVPPERPSPAAPHHLERAANDLAATHRLAASS